MEFTEDEVNDWMARTFGITKPSVTLPQMPSFMEQLEQDPYGSFNQAPAEMRSGNTDFGDYVAQHLGPEAGRTASIIDQGLQTAKPVAAEMTGVPTAERGLGNVAEGMVEGDPARVVGGAAQTALAALPYGAARTAFATVPRALGTTATAAGAPMAASGALTPGDASAQNDVLSRLYEDRNGLVDARSAAQAEMDKQARTGRGPKYKAARREYEKAQRRVETLDKRISKMEYEGSAEFKAKQPFRERYPEVASQLPGAAMAVAAGVPFALRGASRAGSFLPGSKASRFARATHNVEQAIESGNALTAARGARELQAMMPSQASNLTSNIGNPLAAAATGGALAAEAQMFPEQYDYFNLPPDSDGYRQAAETLSDPTNWLKRGGFGMALGLSGYKAAGALPGRSPDVSRAKAAASVVDPTLSDDVMAIRQNVRSVRERLPTSPSGLGTGQNTQLSPTSKTTAVSNQRTATDTPKPQSTETAPRSAPQAQQKPPKKTDKPRSPTLSKKAKVEIAEEFLKNKGSMTQNQGKVLAPKVESEKIKEFLDKLRRMHKDGTPLEALVKQVKRGDVKGIAAGSISAAAASNALLQNGEE